MVANAHKYDALRLPTLNRVVAAPTIEVEAPAADSVEAAESTSVPKAQMQRAGSAQEVEQKEPPRELTRAEINNLVREFIRDYGGAYAGEPLDAVPLVSVDVGDVPKNPDPRIFIRSEDGKRWINKNPRPAWYSFEEVGGGVYVRRDERASAQERAENQDSFVPKGWFETHASNLKSAAWRVGNFTSAYPTLNVGTSRLRLTNLGKGAGGVVAALRIREGLLALREGINEDDGRKKLDGLKELSLGLSFAVPPLAPLGLSVWIFTSILDLRSAADKPEMSAEMNALGWAATASGWLIPSVVKSAAAGAVGRSLGIAGTSLLAVKDVVKLVEGFAERDTGKRVQSLGMLGLDLGLAAGFLGAGAVGAGLIFAGLTPLLIYSWSSKFRNFVDKAFETIDRGFTDKVAPYLSKVFGPVAELGRSLRDKVLWPVEKKLIKWFIDVPAKGIKKVFRPVKWLWNKVGGKKATDKLGHVVADDIIGNVDRQLSQIDKWLTGIAKRLLDAAGAEKEPPPARAGLRK